MKPEVILLFYLCVPVIFMSSCSSLSFECSNLSESRYDTARGVIITADDFGASNNINRGIIRGIEAGFINTVSAMVTFPSALENIELLSASYPGINIGLHLSLTSGYPLADPDEIPSLVNENGSFYSIDQLIPRLDKINLDEVKIELEYQIDSLIRTGIKIDHLSSQHNILHIYSPFTRIVMLLAVEHNLPMRSTKVSEIYKI